MRCLVRAVCLVAAFVALAGASYHCNKADMIGPSIIRAKDADLKLVLQAQLVEHKLAMTAFIVVLLLVGTAFAILDPSPPERADAVTD